MGLILAYDIYIKRKPTMTYLNRLNMIEFIVDEARQIDEATFDEYTLRNDLEEAGNWALEMTAIAYGWV